MRAGLLKPNFLSVDTISSRLNIMNNYSNSFPSPGNKSFSQGEMIDIILSMLPTVWLGSMATAGLEPREKSYEDLLEYLEKLGVSFPEIVIPKKNMGEKASPEKNIQASQKEKNKKTRRSGLAKKRRASGSLVNSVNS